MDFCGHPGFFWMLCIATDSDPTRLPQQRMIKIWKMGSILYDLTVRMVCPIWVVSGQVRQVLFMWAVSGQVGLVLTLISSIRTRMTIVYCCCQRQFTRLPGLLLIWQSGTVDSWQRFRSFLLQKGSLTFSQTCRGSWHLLPPASLCWPVHSRCSTAGPPHSSPPGTKIWNIFIIRYRKSCNHSCQCYYFTWAMPQHLSTMPHWEVEGSRGRLEGWPGLYPGGGLEVSSTPGLQPGLEDSSTPGLLPCWLASRGR